MSNPNRPTPRAQEMFSQVEKYLASGLSQKAFCAQEAIALSTFFKITHSPIRFKMGFHRTDTNKPS